MLLSRKFASAFKLWAKPGPQPVLTATYGFLYLPPELRLAIYQTIAPRGFLPCVPASDYMGLFLSCKTIYSEMEHKVIQGADIISELRSYLDTFVEFKPLQPSFSSIMHITVSVPRWALGTIRKQTAVLESLRPLCSLHLSSLTIILDDRTNAKHLGALKLALPRDEWLEYMCINAAIMEEHAKWLSKGFQGGRGEEYYTIETTYKDIIYFASRINCLVGPSLCAGKHGVTNDFLDYCICNNVASPRRSVLHFHTRKVMLKLKKLDEDKKLYKRIYPHSFSFRVRVSPALESVWLREQGWKWRWVKGDGEKGCMLSKELPACMVWEKI